MDNFIKLYIIKIGMDGYIVKLASGKPPPPDAGVYFTDGKGVELINSKPDHIFSFKELPKPLLKLVK